MSEIRAYAEAHGLSYSGAYKRLHPDAATEYRRRDSTRPERIAAKRAAALAATKPCPRCGKEMGPNSRYRNRTSCQACRIKQNREDRLARGREIAALWNGGATMAEIGVYFGWTVNHVGVEMVWLRKQGIEMRRRRDVAV